MTPKISRFLAESRPETPCLVLDLDIVEANYRAIAAAIPAAKIFYAVKANPGRPILERLASLGSCFDTASWEEIALCLAAGAPPERISFGNTIKKASAIRRAHDAGIDCFVFDCEPELEKIAANAPGSRVFCRLAVGAEGAVFPLTRKFGTNSATARALLHRAAELGLRPIGVSFHVGSQQAGPDAHEAAIGQAAMLFDELEQEGIKLDLVNLGGGFPARYLDDAPGIESFGPGIARALRYHFGNDLPEIWVEPGRFIAGSAGVISAEIVLISHRTQTDPIRWVYLDIGKFGGLSETEGELVRYRITTPRDGGPDAPAVLAGPTCDSADTLYERASYRMPLDLAIGDRVTFHAAGAYTTSYASQGFNGFPPLAEHYI